MSQAYTIIDSIGNRAQYTVYEADHHDKYHWSTDHGDRGFDGTLVEAQTSARTALKSSMAVMRRAGQRYQ